MSASSTLKRTSTSTTQTVCQLAYAVWNHPARSLVEDKDVSDISALYRKTQNKLIELLTQMDLAGLGHSRYKSRVQREIKTRQLPESIMPQPDQAVLPRQFAS